jgi:SRSO17 transposase
MTASPFVFDAAAEQRFGAYLESIGDVLGNDARRASFSTYALGLLCDAERKSVEPIAAMTCTDPQRVDAAHQRLLHFTVDSRWSDSDVRRTAAS